MFHLCQNTWLQMKTYLCFRKFKILPTSIVDVYTICTQLNYNFTTAVFSVQVELIKLFNSLMYSSSRMHPPACFQHHKINPASLFFSQLSKRHPSFSPDTNQQFSFQFTKCYFHWHYPILHCYCKLFLSADDLFLQYEIITTGLGSGLISFCLPLASTSVPADCPFCFSASTYPLWIHSNPIMQ